MRVVITGASRGIGREFVNRYLRNGAEVHAVSRNPARLTDLNPIGKLTLHDIDLQSSEGPAALAKSLEGRPVDLLINNAGTYLDDDRGLPELPIDTVRQSFEVNTLLAMRMCQSLLPNLLAVSREFKRPAQVCQITSLMGSIADNTSGGAYGYRMSKAALNMFNRSFAIDYPTILSVVLHPGWVKTDMGGADAPTSIETSVAGMMNVLSHLKADQSGKFYDYEGDELPW